MNDSRGYPQVSRVALATLLALAGAQSAAAADLFSAYSAIPTGSWPEAVAIGDVNGDGANDVVLTTTYYFDEANDFKLFVFLQDPGSGTLLPAQRYDTDGTYTNSPSSLAIADFNGDGRNEVAIGLNQLGVQLFSQDASGQLVAGPVHSFASSRYIAAGDLNSDGRTDLVGIGWSGSDVGVFLQDASGSLQPAVTYYAPYRGYNDLKVADINGDGRDDIAIMSGQGLGEDLAVLMQSAAGGFDPVSFYDIGGASTNSLGIGDVDSNGHNDLLFSYYDSSVPSSFIGTFYQDDQGVFGLPSPLTSLNTSESMVVTDVNLDGRDDVVVVYNSFSRLGVYLQGDDGQLAAEDLYPTPYASHYNPQGIAVGDFTGDGVPDVAMANYNQGLVVMFGTTESNQPPVADAGDDQVVLAHEPVELNGGASWDAEGAIVEYQWRQLSGTPVVWSWQASPAQVSFLAPWGSSQLVFELTVTDSSGQQASDQVVVEVQDSAPVAVAGPDQVVAQRQVATLDGTASYDLEGPIASYLWRQTSGASVTLIAGEVAGQVWFEAPRYQFGSDMTFELVVTDLAGNQAVDEITVLLSKR